LIEIIDKENMSKLNCSPGDLAITVNCICPENLGNIVKVVEYLGLKDWGMSDESLPTWGVEIQVENRWLLYELDGYPQTSKSGPVPDRCLRRIAPPDLMDVDEVDLSNRMNFDEFICIKTS
jgi:hypothetical protein